jgi:hypothetical protein
MIVRFLVDTYKITNGIVNVRNMFGEEVWE